MQWNEMHGVLQKMWLNKYKESQVQLETLCTPSSHLKKKTSWIDGLLFPVSTEKLRFVSDNLLQHEDEINEFQNYFDYIMANSNFHLPSNWREAEWLYLQFVSIATQ